MLWPRSCISRSGNLHRNMSKIVAVVLGREGLRATVKLLQWLETGAKQLPYRLVIARSCFVELTAQLFEDSLFSCSAGPSCLLISKSPGPCHRPCPCDLRPWLTGRMPWHRDLLLGSQNGMSQG